MNFGTVGRRLVTYSWLIILLGIGFGLLFFPWVSDKQYQAAIGVGLNFNKLKDAQISGSTASLDNDLAYVESLKEFSLYLEKRLSSIEIQDLVARTMNIQNSTYNEKKPFYEVTNSNGGFASMSYTADTEQKANDFITGAKTAYTQVVSEWNEQRGSAFSINPMNNFTQTVATTSRPKQLQALPAIIGITIGIGLALVLPIADKKIKPAKK